MTYVIKKAEREPTTVLVAFAGPSGGGKTMSAILFATGLAGGKRICVIDLERKRSTQYAERFDFDILDLEPPHTPARIAEAHDEAVRKGYGVIVLDGFSNEWSGDGGCLDMQEEAIDRMSRGDAARAEKLTALAWKTPKLEHKRMMRAFFRSPAHLIFTLKAEDKLKVRKQKDENGKEKTVFESAGFVPICEKHFMYEMTASFLLEADPLDRRGFPKPIKLNEDHAAFFPLDRPVGGESGKLFARWASAKSVKAPNPGALKTALAVVRAAKSIGELKAIRDELREQSANMSPAEAEQVREAFQARVVELKK